MKTLVMALMMASAGLVSAAAPALADHVCLDVRNMVSSKSTDGKTMVFKMKDGTTYVNHLQGYCPDLKYEGFSWALRSGDTMVCENAQPFYVNHSGQICTLGKFDAPMTEKHASN
jgi:hypothetical protein